MDELIEKWTKRLSRIENEQLIPLLRSCFHYEELQEVLSTPGEKLSHMFYDRLRLGHIANSCTAVRRLVDTHKGKHETVSFLQLLEEVQEALPLMTREWFVSRYSVSMREDYGEPEFDKFVGEEGLDRLPAKMLVDDIAELIAVSSKIKTLVDKSIAHTDVDQSTTKGIQYTHLDNAVATISRLFDKYELLIRGGNALPRIDRRHDSIKAELEKIWPPQPPAPTSSGAAEQAS